MLSYALVIALGAVVGGGLFGVAWWWIGKESVENGSSEAEAEAAARHKLRNELSELIASGRIHQNSLVTVGRGFLDRDRTFALTQAIDEWHMRVIKFTAQNISQADAGRVMAPTPSVQYPKGLQDTILFDGGKSGIPIFQSWDILVSDLGHLERFLDSRPELTELRSVPTTPSRVIAQNGRNNIAQIGDNNTATIVDENALRLSDGQVAALSAALLPFAGRSIKIQLQPPTSQTTVTFAEQLLTAFQGANLLADISTLQFRNTALPSGLSVEGDDSNREFFKVLAATLREQGVIRAELPGRIRPGTDVPTIYVTP